MTTLSMIYRRPTGFSDPEYYEKPVTVVGFASGRDGIHAVFVTPVGYLDSAPIQQFVPAPPTASSSAG